MKDKNKLKGLKPAKLSIMRLLLLFFPLLCLSCSANRNQKQINIEKDVVDIKDEIQEIDFGDKLFNAHAEVQVVKKVLIISNPKDYPNQIHLIDKNDFRYLTSTAPVGQGPGEITSLGEILTNEAGSELYVQDYARYQFFTYNIDSVLTNPEYKPALKWNLDRDIFPITLQMLNDTLSIGVIGMPTSPSEIHIQTGFWNMETNEIRLLDNLYPEDNHVRYDMAASSQDNLIVEAHWYKNLVVLRSFDGTEICRITGPTEEHSDYYRRPVFAEDKLFILYQGLGRKEQQENKYFPVKIVAFDLKGNYIRTFDTGYNISSWCYDKDNHRFLFSINDDIQFGYLDLDKLNLN